MIRDELVAAFETKLSGEDGFIIRCDAYRHPVTGSMIDRNANKQANMPDLKSAIIEIEESPDGSERLERHIVFFWDGAEQVKKNVQFYCVNRGQPDEVAMWLKAQEPKPDPTGPTFQQEMVVWLNSQIDVAFGTMTLRHVESTSANNAVERGTAGVIMEDGAGDFVRKSVAIWKDASEEWQFQVIVSA